MRYVYSPVDDPLETHWNAEVVRLAPNKIHEIEDHDLAEKLVGLWGARGVSEVGSTDVVAEKELIDAAEEVYKGYLLRTDGQLVQDHEDQRASAAAVGLATLGESLQVAAAKQRLVKRGLLKVAKKGAKAGALLLLALLLPALAGAQVTTETRLGVLRWDADSETRTYCSTDPGFSTTGDAIKLNGTATVSGTTLTADDATLDIFAQVTANDLLFTRTPGQTRSEVFRAVDSATSADAVEIGTTVSWTAVELWWLPVTCGTSSADGWINVSGFSTANLCFQADQFVVTTSIDAVWEADFGPGTSPTQIYPAESTSSTCCSAAVVAFTATGGVCVGLTKPYQRVRVGVTTTGGDDGDDATTNRELLNVFVRVERTQ